MKTLLFVYLALFILIASSCGKSGNTEATVSAVNPNCVTNPSTCNSAAYQQSNGYSPYGYNGNNSGNYGGNYGDSSTYNNGYNGGPFNYYGNTAYLCNCPNGSVPTYNGSNGLGCVRSAGLNLGVYGYLYLSWGNNGNQWSNLPQMYQYNYNQTSSCYNGAVQSCTVGGAANNCPAGSVCRPNTNGSTIGLCVTSYR